MKKIFSLFVASVMAMSLFAGELTMDLSTAQGYSSEGGSCTPVVAEGVLDASWTVAKAWDVAGVEFVLPDLTGVTKINFDLKGDGQEVTLYVYLVDANGGLKWEAEHWISLSSTDWASLEITPNADLWGNHGEEPWKKLVIVANPGGEIVSGAFSIRDLKITCDYEPVVAKPDTAYGVTRDEADVMALYCNHYTTNNLNYDVQHWDGRAWEVLKLGADSTNVCYCASMAYDGLASNPIAARDFSGYKRLHFEVWAPEACSISLTVETETGVKHYCPFTLNAGWNTIDADPAWWDKEGAAYDWKDVKFLIFDQYKTADGSESFEGNPFAFANIYFWNDPAPSNIPAEAPAAPVMAEEKVIALFSTKYQTRTFNFAPQNWGGTMEWIDYEYANGEHIFYTDGLRFDAFTNWDTCRYEIPETYDMMHIDIYVTLDSKMKLTFEALSQGEGGSGWKNGASFDLVGNEWNSIEVDLLNAPYADYDFTDLRYFLLEGFVKPDDSSAEGTPVAVANAYFYNSMDQAVENVDAEKVAVKRLIDGRLVIEKNGKRYNAIGTQF